MIIATAVFECLPSQIAVVWASFVEYDCHQAIANMIKVAVFLEAFTISTVSSEKSSFDMTAGKESFDFCTVVLCCLGSRKSK